MENKVIEIENGKVRRRFTQSWDDQGDIKTDKIPQIINSMIIQRVNMIEYIEVLHDKIDNRTNLKHYAKMFKPQL
jgi:hypothetical protein